MTAVGLVVVSHSRALADAAIALAREMLHGNPVRIAVAAGLDATTFGTDATQVVDAITDADDGAGVVVLMDLGSAVLSAELALELLDDDARARVVLSPAPLVEGLVVAAVVAAGGAEIQEVADEAAAALRGKLSQLGPPAVTAPSAPADGASGRFVVANPHGLHARPAALLAHEARSHVAIVSVRNLTSGSEWVDASSITQIATLGVRTGDEVEVRASGDQAADALERILALADRDFSDAG